MAPGKSPAFQFYANDFISGTLTLSLEECGAYITLLAYQWDTGSIPAGAAARARICRCSVAQSKRIWVAIEGKFQQGEDGLWRNARLESERTKQDAYRELQRDKGLASARNRATNRKATEPQPSHQPNGQPEGDREVNRESTLLSSSSSSSSREPLKNNGSPSPRPIISGENNPKIWGKLHGDHVTGFCDWVCLPEFLFSEFARKSAGPDYVREWALSVRAKCEGQTVGDNLKFWRLRWSETHVIHAKPLAKTAAEINAELDARDRARAAR